MKVIKLISLIILVFTFHSAFALERIFYALRTHQPDHLDKNQHVADRLAQQYHNIDLIISQAYRIDGKGNVTGYLDPQLINFVKAHHLKLMVLVTNDQFDTDKAHQFLSNPSAQNLAIQTILQLCQENHFDGVQFDFEMITLKDRDALTQFYQKAADVLHQNHFRVSFAVAPVVTDNLQESLYLRRLYERWEGAYDLKALSKAGDFLSVMAYNQHGDGTTPGSTSSVRWTEAAVKYALCYIPASKISLGIPVYSNFWYTGAISDKPNAKISVHENDLNYSQVQDIIKKNHLHLSWSDQDKIHYAIYNYHWLNQYLFVEDVDSFRAKLKLASKYHLRGISVFDLSTEDPRIWKLLAHKESSHKKKMTHHSSKKHG